MADLTEARADQRQEGVLDDVEIAAATKIFAGSNVNYGASGLGKKASDTASERYAGVAMETVDNTAGAAAAEYVRVWKEGIFSMNCASATRAWEGKDVYAVDDNLVALAATTTNDVRVGTVVKYVSATEVRVKI